MSPEIRGLDVVQTLKSRLQNLKPIPPTEIGESPLLENVAFGSDVNVLKFPTPKWHADDGGRYIGTFTATVCRDPDTGYINVGTYRVQVHDENTVGVWMIPGKHGDLITRKYWARGEPCPVAIVCGLPPGLMMASAVGIPWNVSEYDFLGGLLEAPVPVIKGQKTGLPVPAFADIVLEGYIPPPEQETREEGPFGEWPGYYASGSRHAPVVKVEAVYHRNDPIITGDPPLRTFLNSEAHKYIRSANIWSPWSAPASRTCAGCGSRGRDASSSPWPSSSATRAMPSRRVRRARHPRRRPGRAHGHRGGRGRGHHQHGRGALGHVHPLGPQDRLRDPRRGREHSEPPAFTRGQATPGAHHLLHGGGRVPALQLEG